MTKLDRKGVLSYIAVTLAITYAFEGALIASGFASPTFLRTTAN